MLLFVFSKGVSKVFFFSKDDESDGKFKFRQTSGKMKTEKQEPGRGGGGGGEFQTKAV